jgi:hypothetical protein
LTAKIRKLFCEHYRINKVSYDSEIAKNALRSLAVLEKKELDNLNNTELLTVLETKKKELNAIIDSELVQSRGINKSQEFVLVYFNSNERMSKYSELIDALAGVSTW